MAETRKAFVQQLRWLGRECGVPLVRDDARRERVVAFTEIMMTCISHQPCILKENTSEFHLGVTKVSPFFSVPVWAMGPGTM